MTDLAVTRADGVLRLHLDREEKRNALNAEILDGMLAALREPGDARVAQGGEHPVEDLAVERVALLLAVEVKSQDSVGACHGKVCHEGRD